MNHFPRVGSLLGYVHCSGLYLTTLDRRRYSPGTVREEMPSGVNKDVHNITWRGTLERKNARGWLKWCATHSGCHGAVLPSVYVLGGHELGCFCVHHNYTASCCI